MNQEFLKSRSKYYFIIAIFGGLIVAVFLTITVFNFLKEKPQPLLIKKTTTSSIEEVIKKLTAPENGSSNVPSDVIEKLTAPVNNVVVSEEILEKLTAPAK